jgi:isopentenyl-diphosphate Delta-isomerase
MAEELVVLINQHNEPIGTMAKHLVHSAQTPLHRGFSVFLFNNRQEVLLQQRSGNKITWPKVWSNSCCGHPHLGETSQEAARRRLYHELGLIAASLEVIEDNFRYKAEMNGIVEHEICPILVGKTNEQVTPNPSEVEQIKWVDWETFVTQISQDPTHYSPWCVEEVKVLETSSAFKKFMKNLSKNSR